MDEKLKSIWKKSWTGWRGLLLGWLVLMIVTMIISLVIMLAAGGRITSEEINLSLVFSLCATVGFFIVLFIHWLFCWRNFKRFLFGLACFATLIALFYAEEDWRGKHDWEKFKREWAAKGERFDWQSIVPPPVPDDQNFALTPVIASSYEMYFDKNGHEVRPRNTNVVDRLSMITWRDNHWAHIPKSDSENHDWQASKKTDLKAWQDYFRSPPLTNSIETNSFPVAPQPQTPAADILLALSKYDSAIAEIRAASQLSYSRFPLTYERAEPFAILLPHLAAVKSCALAVSLRALAELQNGQGEKATEDVKLSLYLSGSIRTEPFLISHLVRIVILQITLQPIYEGLANHQWSDTQLAELDSELAKLDFLADYKTVIRGCPAFDIASIEFFRHLHDYPQDLGLKRPRFYFLAPFFSLVQMLSNLSSNEGPQMKGFPILALSFGPSGWLNQNEMHLCQLYMKWYLPIVDENAEIISPARVRAAADALGQAVKHQTPENVFETLFVPGLGGASVKIAHAQSSANMARVAIALERYWLANGNYPDSLDAIAAQFPNGIPHDIINGKPLKYRRMDNGQFVLYSVGWNEKDDGGVVVFGKGETPSVDTSRGDWVWRYPAKN
jgi:hypothetical protein